MFAIFATKKDAAEIKLRERGSLYQPAARLSLEGTASGCSSRSFSLFTPKKIFFFSRIRLIRKNNAYRRSFLYPKSSADQEEAAVASGAGEEPPAEGEAPALEGEEPAAAEVDGEVDGMAGEGEEMGEGMEGMEGMEGEGEEGKEGEGDMEGEAGDGDEEERQSN